MPAAVLCVRVRPGFRKSELRPPVNGEWRLAIAAPPVDGKANAACVAFLAKLLGIAKSNVSLSAGKASRRKRFRIEGLAAAELDQRLRAAVDNGGS